MGKGCKEQSRHETLVCVCGGCRREAGVPAFASGATLMVIACCRGIAFLCPARPTAVSITRVSPRRAVHAQPSAFTRPNAGMTNGRGHHQRQAALRLKIYGGSFTAGETEIDAAAHL